MPEDSKFSYSSLLFERNSPPASTAPSEVYDLIIIGAGLAGAGAALQATKNHLKVLVLEKHQVASGQSGVCGGQFIPGFEASASDLVDKFGFTDAKNLYGISLKYAQHLFLQDCLKQVPVQKGGLVVALTEEDAVFLKDEYTALLGLGLNCEQISANRLYSQYLKSPLYKEALLCHDTRHANPKKITQALLQEALKNGAYLKEHTEARALSKGSGSLWEVSTTRGTFIAKHVFLAGADTVFLKNKMWVPTVEVQTWQIITEPISAALQKELMPQNSCVYDTQELTMDYFRFDDKNRFILGGGDSVAKKSCSGVDFLAKRVPEIFPQLKGIKILRSWSGFADVSSHRFPIWKDNNNLWLACGYSGHGTVNAYASGVCVANAIIGNAEDWLKMKAATKAQLTLQFPANKKFRKMSGWLGAKFLQALST